MSANNLTGAIPPSLGSLAELVRLDLAENQLRGYIPSELGELPNLQYLYLHNNLLGGQVPLSLRNITARRIGLPPAVIIHGNHLCVHPSMEGWKFLPTCR